MRLDFLYRLQEHIETLGLFAPSAIGNLEYDDSIALIASPGGIKTLFHDGTRDQTYNIDFSSKSKAQQHCLESLDDIMSSVIQLTDLPSQNGSYQFVEINIESPPTFVGQDEQGYFIYNLSATARMFIKKGAI